MLMEMLTSRFAQIRVHQRHQPSSLTTISQSSSSSLEHSSSTRSEGSEWMSHHSSSLVQMQMHSEDLTCMEAPCLRYQPHSSMQISQHLCPSRLHQREQDRALHYTMTTDKTWLRSMPSSLSTLVESIRQPTQEASLDTSHSKDLQQETSLERLR